jgi:peroxiredoxin Q/BCP
MASLEGKQAPDFSLEGSDGNTYALKDFAGQTTVLYFYPRDNTPGCTKEACAFRDIYPELEKMGVQLFGISNDKIKTHAAFAEAQNLPFVLLSDPKGQIMRRYSARGKKVMRGKVTESTTRSTVVIGRDGKIIKHWEQVSQPAYHPAAVLAFLKNL